MNKSTEEFFEMKTCSPTGNPKSDNGNIILEEEKFLDRWAVYLSDFMKTTEKITIY